MANALTSRLALSFAEQHLSGIAQAASHSGSHLENELDLARGLDQFLFLSFEVEVFPPGRVPRAQHAHDVP